MPIFALTDEILFPPPELADENGIIAIGGDVKPQRLLAAYRAGIFPWPHGDYPLMWFCPAERFVLSPKDLHRSRSLIKAMRKGRYEIRFDTCFEAVMRSCQVQDRPDQDGTWITDELIEGYTALHEMGFAHSTEAFENGALVGGMYGVSVGGTFCGESMFTKAPNASKVALATLVAHLCEWDFDLFDCQNESTHMGSFGARLISRREFLNALHVSQKKTTRRGKWHCVLQPQEIVAKAQGGGSSQ